ncbi:MAG: glutamate 5-kinase [Anaerolineae bacterium]|nr:glutamate 5-kinase [Anaerolineae bacterium]
MRIVIKVGTNVLRAGTERLYRPRLVDLARQIATLISDGHEPLLVSSGAIFAGRELLGIKSRSQTKGIPHKQMLAAVGQGRLLTLYQQIFALYDITVAQALLTRADLAHRTRYLNARNTLHLLLQQKVLPIINENDVVAVEEIKFGDNDTLSALVANLIDADLLIMLTDQPGLFTKDPRQDASAQLIQEVVTINDAIRAAAGGSNSGVGAGGMVTKIRAAELATRSGVEAVIAPGSEPDCILRVVKGETLGTRFPSQVSHVESRKRWILAEAAQGEVKIDAGAAEALIKRGKSLLAVGVIEVAGNFNRGATIRVLNPAGQEIGRGITNYKSEDLSAIQGKRSDQIEEILGFDYGHTVIHRDNLVIV